MSKKYIQEHFISLLPLDGYKKLSSTKINCRCFICGDSKTNKRKKRGFFLWNKRYDTYVFTCHNCGASTNFNNVCKTYAPSLYEQYKIKEREENFNAFLKTQREEVEDYDDDVVGISILPDGSRKCIDVPECLDKLIERKVPMMFIKKWMYHKDFGLVVPFELDDEDIYGWQARQLKEKVFHIELPEENYKIWNWYGVDKKKPVFICESIIDATMLYRIGYQAIAILGSDIETRAIEELSEPIFIFDNDETGFKKLIKYSKAFNQAKFLQFDKRIKQKDLNEIVKDGIPDDKLKKFIDTHIKTGFQIQVELKLSQIL
jgi:hypothetical protein